MNVASKSRDPIWRMLEDDGRRLTWLAGKIGYASSHVYGVKAGALTATPRFRARCAEVLGRSESELFADVPDEEGSRERKEEIAGG